MGSRTISVRYGEAVQSFIGFARTLTADEWATPVPCTPAWTVRDVLSHVSGIPDDAFAGRMDGAISEPWTASQVERNRDFAVGELLERWESQYQAFGDVIEQMKEHRPPIDCHSHEHDVRQALGRPGNRDSAIIDDVATAFVTGLDVPVEIVVTYEDGATVMGGRVGGERVALTTTKFEMFRSRLGRRTVDQVRSLVWTGDDDAIGTAIAGWFSFGPSEVPIIE